MSRFIILILICFSHSSFSQYFQYSQYNFTPQRINPAQVGSTDYASLSFDYRNQATDGGFHLSSNIVNAEYPLISRKGTRWSGVGISLMDDRSGKAGIFNTQEIGLSYAVQVHIARYQHIALGVKALYQNRKIDMSGLYTGSQYITDRGFDESISSGENLGLLKNNFITFSTGLYWQQTDKNGSNLAYWGISFFDFNKPDDSFLESSSQLNSTLVGSLGFRIYHRGNLSVFPELLFTHSASTNVVNAGAIVRAELNPNTRQPQAYVDLITKYVVGRSGILGLQFHNEKFSVGFSYDFPLLSRNVANTGAFELGVALRKLVTRNPKNRSRTNSDRSVEQGQTGKKLAASVGVRVPRNVTTQKVDSAANTALKNKTALSDRLKQKQDSVITLASAGQVSHEPLILEKATLYFNFEFNSTMLDVDARAYLDELAAALEENPELTIRLVGHTDNIGSDKFNLRLSLHRAQSLKDYLTSRHVASDRIDVEGKGMQAPLNNNETEEDRAVNRRVELTISYAH